MFKKILIGTILFAVVAVLLLQIDDNINPEVAAFLEQAEPAEHSEAYLYLLGIVAEEGEDPLTVGKQLFASMQQAEENYTFGDEDFEYGGYPEGRELPLPHGELFCDRKEDECWQTIFLNTGDIEQVLTANDTLLHRYQTFIKMNNYHTLAKPTLQEVFPPFHYLIKANRLIMLKVIHMTESAEAANMLIVHIAALRQHLESADNLIGKMIYSELISESFDVLSLVVHQRKSEHKNEIPLLSLQELSFETAMPREFAMNHELYINLDQSPDLFAKEKQGIALNPPPWVVTTFYKPNMTINAEYSFFKEVISNSKLDQLDFTIKVTNDDSRLPNGLGAKVRNHTGYVLSSIARPNFDQYIARLLDLNAKIALFNQTANKAELPEDLGHIKNPYYETANTAFYSEDGKSICLTGPLEDDKNQRCVRVKL
ncbi:MAG: hypothetical protein ACKE8G_06585 [Methylophagaceae bacterium]